MNDTTAVASTNFDLKKIIIGERSLPYKLLIVLLVFGSFRPDRLIPGGKFLVHFPTILMIVLFFFWLKSSPKILKNPQTKLLLFFGTLMCLHIPFARNAGYAYNITSSFLFFTILSFLYKIQFIDSFSKLDLYIRLSFVFALFFVVMGIINNGRVGIPMLQDENDYCLFINTLIPLGYFLGKEASTKKMKLFYYSTLILFILAVISSFSRGGFVGLVAVILFIFWQSKQKIPLIFLTLIMSFAAYQFAPQKYWDEINTINLESRQTGTGRQRIDSWKAGWEMFLDNPLLGVGPGNYGPNLTDYWETDNLSEGKKRTPEQMWGRVAHSLYFTLLPEMGLVGTLLFLGILFHNHKNHQHIRQLYQRTNNSEPSADLNTPELKSVAVIIRKLYFISHAFSGSLVALLITGIFISVLWYPYFWAFTSFFLIGYNLTRNAEKVLHLIDKPDARKIP